MIEAYKSSTESASEYWIEEMEGFDYMFSASPAIINKLREHCYHITGIHSYGYRKHHAHKMLPFKNKLNTLKSLDQDDLFVPENKQLGGFGHDIDGEIVNLDTLKFYESVLAINKIDNFFVKNADAKLLAVEIGGGWGGFGHVFKQLIPNATYIIVDLPATLLFSSVYLSAIYPNKKIYLYSDDTYAEVQDKLNEFDFVFLPCDKLNEFKFKKIDIAINMISFQEMTSSQVSNYLDWLDSSNVELLYSHNRGKSPHNNELSDVHDLIESKFDLHNIDMLKVPYTVLSLPKSVKKSKKTDARHVGVKGLIKSVYKSLAVRFSSNSGDSQVSAESKESQKLNKVDYRHIYATKIKQN